MTKERLKIPNAYSEGVNRKTENTTKDRKDKQWSTTLHKKLKINQL
jgi:hypothetical protein